MRVPARFWPLLLALLAAACGESTAPPPAELYAPDPADAVFVTSDIDNFWRGYDAFRRSGNVSGFQSEYLDRASPGLRDFIQARALTATSLGQMVNAFRQYFDAIRPNTLRLATQAALLDEIRQNFARIEALYPASVYPPVTFLIGRFSTGGTIRQSGMLIGAEFFAIDADTPLQELGAFQRATVRPLDSIPLIVAHEHAHILQTRFGSITRQPTLTLLSASLAEGAADFLAEIAAGSHPNKHIHAYGLAHEAALWAEFIQVMNGTDISDWLYNQGSTTDGRPGDLGYFIGYRVTQAYHNKATDKTAAIREIIEVSNPVAFLAASGYSPT
jgi:hypothetical protein